ncbi:hypothetical protein NQU59_15960 [Acinetobacter colistiniresistens]|uniref:hypothetical protein n=1 Tax=Acinetobacter colistiniresistens TaxID=280145 RepID=UPI00211BF5BE|nr:hypothetical protein [Acinetobacter colistiniresistens]UUM27138.1 hypothetical protein NQU59_15960 [Acinetobacter colistiniresistens]
MKRFFDDGKTWNTFTQYPILVVCPFCQSHALVIQYEQNDQTEKKIIFSCGLCCKTFDQSLQQQKNLGYFDEINLDINETCSCKRGKYNFSQSYAQPSVLPPFIKLSCDFCQKEKVYNSPYTLFIHKIPRKTGFEINTDPFFGYRLYLTTETRHGLIFVYNTEQLNDLKAYISAELRQRTYTNKNKAYLSRLPSWIKSARNRKEILKAILRLEQMASTIQPLTNK